MMSLLWEQGQPDCTVLWPESTASGKEVNEDAMVLEMISKDFKGLFTGDIGMVTE